ncbi:RAD51-associated protein 2 [Notamacropus eugenii]|uniref:RAD51-associated protein 2 n=1 Tax=Notamacropus eugenii TaxID=9315 RepID=UPI003B670937
MEALPGSPSGPPQAKRPRLGEDAPHAPLSRAQAPEGGAASTQLPRPHGALPALSLGPLLFLAPLLGGPMPRGKEGVVGGSAFRGAPPKRRPAPSAACAEESPSSKIPRGQLRALSIRGTGGAPGAPQVIRVGERSESLPPPPLERSLWSSGHIWATRPANTCGENAPASTLAFLRAGRAATPLGAPGSRLGARAAAAPSGIFLWFAVVPAGQKARSGSAWFGGGDVVLPMRRSAPQHRMSGSLGLRSRVGGAPAAPPGPAPALGGAPARPAGPPGPAPVFLAEIAEESVTWARRPRLLLPLVVALGSPRGAAGAPPEHPRHVRSLEAEACLPSALLVLTQQASSRPRPLTASAACLEGGRLLLTAFAADPRAGAGSECLLYPNDVPGRKFRKTDDGWSFVKAQNGPEPMVPKTSRCDTAPGKRLLLAAFKASSPAVHLSTGCEHHEVRERRGHKAGGCASEVTEACRGPATENVRREFEKYRSHSFHVIPRDTLFAVLDTFEKVPLVSNFGDVCSIALSKRAYSNNASSGKARNLEALGALNGDIPQFTHRSQINAPERVHQANANSQETVTEKKQMFAISSFDFKDDFNCFLETEHRVKDCDTIYIGPNTTTETQEEFVGNFLCEGKEKIQILIQNERKHPTESFTGTRSYQISNGNEIQREQKYSITNTNTMVCLQKSNLLMKRKPNLEHTREINQTDRNEHQTILQESALAYSKLFHRNNESTEFVNWRFKTDLAARNNECPPDLRAECLSTETKMINDLEMKREFDIVLKELCMFCEIGKEEETLANSRLFHPKNVSTEFNHELKTDLITRNNKCSPDITAECLSTETKTMSDFEMKSEFDIVLKELCMFHEIGKEEEISCIGETSNNEGKKDFDKDNSMEEVHQEIKDTTVFSLEKICPPSLPSNTIKSVNMPKTVQSSYKWKKIHMDPEKEIPHDYCSSSSPDAELLHSPSGDDFEKAFCQNPDLFSDAFMEGKIHSLLKGDSSSSHGIVRVYPLQTCRGPIRIGLSRKAKPRQLHPYLK